MNFICDQLILSSFLGLCSFVFFGYTYTHTHKNVRALVSTQCEREDVYNKIIIGIFLLQEKNVSFEFVLFGMYRFYKSYNQTCWQFCNMGCIMFMMLYIASRLGDKVTGHAVPLGWMNFDNEKFELCFSLYNWCLFLQFVTQLLS